MSQYRISNENERKTLIVVILTIVTMLAEIIFGYKTHSMALLADGFHMGTHALALGLTFVAYIFMRKFAKSELFPKGTDKIGILAAYTSSLFLGLTGFWIIYEALNKLLNPVQIYFNEAILVAIIGLIVNAICIFIMDEHNHIEKEHHEHKEDYNYKAAYYHILADALTSILAIGSLLVGKYFGFNCFDSITGIIGGILILKWAASLIRHTVVELIDMKIL